MTRLKNSFFDLILQAGFPSRSQFLMAIESVKSNPSQITIDEETQNDLVLDLDDVALRLKTFFDLLGYRETSKNLADVFVTNILLPVVHASGKLTRLETTTMVLISGLPIIRNSSATIICTLAKAILATQGLVERLITDHKGGQVMKEWIYNHRNSILDSSLLQSLTQRLMTLCETCTHDHGTTVLSKRWQDLMKAKTFLETVEPQLRQGGKETELNTQHIPLLDDLRQLKEDDKKTGKLRTRLPEDAFEIPADVSAGLISFGIERPRSLRTLSTALDRLKVDETFSLLRTAMDSFPCRPCLETICGARNLRGFLENDGETNFEKLTLNSQVFGQRVGVWKVLLSAQALKDMRKIARSGTQTGIYKTSSNTLISLMILKVYTSFSEPSS